MAEISIPGYSIVSPPAETATRLLYENFNDQTIDPNLTTRIYGVYDLDPSYYDLTQVGYGGSGYCLTALRGTHPDSTHYINELFLEYTPGLWPTTKMYVAWRMKFPFYTPNDPAAENIKFFYPAWNGLQDYIAFSAFSADSSYYSTKASGTVFDTQYSNATANQFDGNWHWYEFFVDFENGIVKFWYDGSLSTNKDYGIGTYQSPPSFNYITVGSIDSEELGDTFTRAYDEIEIWDGIPSHATGYVA